jgi:hypothetical protein
MLKPMNPSKGKPDTSDLHELRLTQTVAGAG